MNRSVIIQFYLWTLSLNVKVQTCFWLNPVYLKSVCLLMHEGNNGDNTEFKANFHKGTVKSSILYHILLHHSIITSNVVPEYSLYCIVVTSIISCCNLYAVTHGETRGPQAKCGPQQHFI